MLILTIIFLSTFIPTVELSKPSITLSFNPNEPYFTRQSKVEIQCELLNPTQVGDSAQLWYVDLKTGKRTAVSRLLLTSPSEDAPEIFKKINRNKRYRFVGRNHIEINALQMEDSARYECDCPDCEQNVDKKERKLEVMQLVDPVWTFETSGPLHEDTETKIKCSVNDFYPYIKHKILRDSVEITNIGRSTLSNEKYFPQQLVWEATIKPKADWHGTTLLCDVTQGNTIKHATKTMEVLFAPRFLTCHDRQYVDSKQDQGSIECSYSGNPAPTLVWLRRSDRKAITTDQGVTTEINNESHGKFKSIVKFDRTRLNTNPIQTSLNISGENYYQQLLNNGFIVQLFVNGKEKAIRNITIVSDKSQIQTKLANYSKSLRYSTILVGFLFILHMILR